MYVYTEGHSRIAGTGIYLPEQRVTSEELMREVDSKARFGISYDWLERVTGIRERRAASRDLAPSDMAVAAARQAMEHARIAATEVDAIIYAGLTRDYMEPATAHIVQAKLGARNATVFDVSNACHGFMNGLHVMDALVATGQVRCGLVVTGEQGSLFARRAIDAMHEITDRDQFAALAAGLTLGDAGAAIVVGPKREPAAGFMGFMLHSEGRHARFCTAGGPIAEGPLVTDMPAMITETVKMVVPMFRQFLDERLKWSVAEIARYIVHQTGRKVFKLHSQLGGVPASIIPDTVTSYGNLITATIPLNLHLVHRNKEVRPHDKVFLSGMGSGISLSQAGIVWDTVH